MTGIGPPSVPFGSGYRPTRLQSDVSTATALCQIGVGHKGSIVVLKCKTASRVIPVIATLVG